MTDTHARLLAILKEPDSVTFQNYVREPGDNRNIAVEDWCARHRLKRLCEEYARMVKSAWLTTDTGTLGDADYGSALCEELSAAILALGEDNEHS